MANGVAQENQLGTNSAAAASSASGSGSNSVYGSPVDYVDYTAKTWDGAGNPTSATADAYVWDDASNSDVLSSSVAIPTQELASMTAAGLSGDQISNNFVNGLQEISSLGANAVPIAALSPKLVTELNTLAQDHVVISPSDAGSSTSPNGLTISVDGFGSANNLVEQLSHEVGHSLYAIAGFSPDMSSKQAFLGSELGNEGMAAINNIAVERQIIANGGPDVGIATADPADTMGLYNKYYIHIYQMIISHRREPR